MAVDVPVALLGYGNVGGAVARLLAESADDIERATGHRLRIVRALVRDPEPRARSTCPTTAFSRPTSTSIRDDPSIALVAELMGGIEPTGDYVLELLRAGKPVVSANKQLVARRGAELFAAASKSGVQLRFEASVCAAIPVIKVLRESLVATNVHRVLGIVNGTTNFILSQMEQGAEYPDALAEAQRLGFAEPDPTEDVNGADAAAKMAILATVAFGSRTTLDDVEFDGIEAHHAGSRARGARARDDRAARRLGDARRRQARRARAAVARRPAPSARRRRGAVQRGDAAGRRDSRDHARGAGRRRARDGVGGRRRHDLDRRHDGHRIPAERRVLARARAPSARRPALAVLLPRRGRRPARRARAHRAAARRSTTCRSRDSCSTSAKAARRCTSSRTRRARDRSRPRSRRSPRCPRRSRRRRRCR